MIINLTFDPSVNSAPAGFVQAIDAVVSYYESIFTNNITINIDVGYGEIDGQALSSGALGESEGFYNEYSYSQIRNALIANASSANQMLAASTLPATDPTPGGDGNYWVSTAEAKALGLMGASSSLDGYVGFANTSSATFTYNTTNGGSVAAGTYDFFGVAAHEISEVLGRTLFVGSEDGDGIGPNSYTPYDLLHFSGNGVRDFSGTTAGYFSPDDGLSDLGDFNTNPGGDFGDWASNNGPNSYLAFSNSGVANPVTANDLDVMNALGYDAALPALGAGNAAFGADFAGSGYDDIAWQDSTTGLTTIWTNNGGTVPAETASFSEPNWRLVGTGDFNGNGRSDLLWQNSDGLPAIWLMNGTNVVGATVFGNPGSSWHAVTTGDFNGNGNSDILWQNTDGTAAIWFMNGLNFVSGANLGNPGSAWHIEATGDFNGNGDDDILWQNTNGTAAIWMMNGGSIVGTGVYSGISSSWHIVGTADITGNGDSDILWQNTDGTPAIWLMNGTNVVGAAGLPNLGSAWKLLGGGDFYGTGDNDLLFVNTTTDAVQIWVMNGLQVSSMQTPQSSTGTSQGTASPSSPATPLSSNPVLSEADAYYPATFAAPAGLGAAGAGAQNNALLSKTTFA